MNFPDPSRITHSTLFSETQQFFRRVLSGVSALRPGARQTFLVALALFCFSTIAILFTFADRFYVDVPVSGGALREGIIDSPRFINPVLAKGNADRNLTALVYSGLLRASPSGELIPDLAESYTVTEDGLTYTFTLRPDLYWHDGLPVTSADVVYTIKKIQDPGLTIKSPRRGAWEGVAVEAPDEQTVLFTLKNAYAPFLENATVGILPKHIWGEIPDNEFEVTSYNIDPVGTGPYRIAKIVENKKKRVPLSYELTAFDGYALGAPYITTLTIAFFGNKKDLLAAYQNGEVKQFPTVDPEVAKTIEATGGRITRMHLPLVDAAFFNQNQQPLFADKTVRRALAVAVDKDRIVREVLYGYGVVVDGPVSGIMPERPAGTTTPHTEKGPAAAQALLEGAGWKRDEETGVLIKTDKKKKTSQSLEFSITVPDVPEFRRVAELLKSDWETVGAKVTVKVFETGTFTSEVLAPRKYDILLYGIIARASDPYPYWHSSQRNFPGDNVAMYANRMVDGFLEKIRQTSDHTERDVLLEKLETAITEDVPAIFLYSPDFLYATAPEIKGLTPRSVVVESDRFLGIENWYQRSERVWGFLEKYAVRTPDTEPGLIMTVKHWFSDAD